MRQNAFHHAYWILLMTLIASAAPASLAELPELALRHRDALGGEAVIRAVSSARFLSDVRIVMIKGTIEEMFTAPGNYFVRIKTPVMEQTQGESGGVEWTLDQNGQVVMKELANADGIVAAPVIPMFQYLFPGTGYELEDGGVEMRDDREYRVLRVRDIRRQTTRTLLLNPETFLAERIDEIEDGIPVTTHLSDYREVSGVQIPFTTVQYIQLAGMPETHIELNSAEFNISIPPRVFDPPISARRDFTFPEGKTRHMIDLTRIGDHILIPVRINKKGPYLFLLDSGAAATILNRSLAKDLDLEITEGMQALGVGGTEVFGACQIDSLDIDGFSIQNLKIYSGALDSLSAALGVDIQGILGYDLFARAVIKLDIRASLMTLIEPTNFKYSGEGSVLKGEITGGLMHIEATLDEQWTGTFRVDTGAAGAIHLHSPFVNRNGLVEAYAPHIEMNTMGAGGTTPTFFTRANKFDLGGYRFDRPIVTLQTSETGGALAMRDSIGTIGNDVWSRFTVYFDYPRKRVILEPNPDFDIPLHMIRSGISAVRRDDALVVLGTIPGSPGARKKILPGDRIIEIDGVEITSMSDLDWRASLDGDAGGKVRLKIERGNRVMSRTIRFAEYL